MEKSELIRKIEKIFRANTVKEKVEVGQFGQTEEVEVIEDIEELKSDIIELVSTEYKVGEIDKKEIFIGTGKIGASYSVSEAIEVAKKWGFKYVAWNGGEIVKLNGDRTGLTYDEL
jgi:hypothetical protein